MKSSALPQLAQSGGRQNPGTSVTDPIDDAFGAGQFKHLRVVRYALQQSQARISDSQASASCAMAIGFLDKLIVRGNPQRLELERMHIHSDINALEAAARLLVRLR